MIAHVYDGAPIDRLLVEGETAWRPKALGWRRLSQGPSACAKTYLPQASRAWFGNLEAWRPLAKRLLGHGAREGSQYDAEKTALAMSSAEGQRMHQCALHPFGKG
jgi:hypothetical protein